MKILNLTFVLILMLSLLSNSVFAQLSITPYSGYTFADKTPISGGNARIGDGHTYGIYLSYGLSENYEIEMQYSRQDNKVSANYRYTNILGGISYENISEPASVNYIMIGTNKLIPANEKVTLFTGIKLGVSIISSKNDYFDSITKFAANINGGMKYFFNDKIGLRLQADLGMPMVNLGGSFWWSPKSGVDVGVSGYSPFLQFGFKGGLIFRM